jgi:hypothetical protein
MTASLQTRRATGKRWAIPGTLLSIASVVIAGTDLVMQIFLAPPTGIALGHALFALVVCLVGIVLSVTWSARLQAKPVPLAQPMEQAVAPDISEEQTFVIVANNPTDISKNFIIATGNLADSGKTFMAITGNPADSGKTFAAITGKSSDSGRYGQPMPLYSTEEVSIRRAALGVPISSDPLFGFAQPMAGERCFVLPREGEPLVECQDRYALNAAKRLYAVADGVSGSFLPGPWASIIAQGFVDHSEIFSEKETFSRWLYDCCASWNAWMQQRWVPAMNWQRQLQGEQSGDWSEEIIKGAQTTLTGVAIGQANAAGLIDISVWAIGDTQFFVFRRGNDGLWAMQTAFPLTNPAQFGYKPDTLFTIAHPFLFEQAWTAQKTQHCMAQTGDYVVLATDTLAKWIMQQAHYPSERLRLTTLLQSAHLDQFSKIVHEELRAKRIEEDDDMTMLVIPV